MQLGDVTSPKNQQIQPYCKNPHLAADDGESQVEDDFTRTPSPSAEHGFDLANLDPSVKPQKDFFHYAVGGWIENHPIPSNKTSVGSFEGLAERNRAALHNILEGLLTSKAPAGSEERKLADFYASGMDTATIDAAGAKPLQPIFDQISSVSNHKEMMTELAHLHDQGIGSLFGFYCSQDAKNSTQNIGEIGQGGLGLPERDYYFKTDDKSKEIRQAYQDHIQRTFQLLGDSPEKAAEGAASVMKLETRLADTSMTSVELRDPSAGYNITSRDDLKKLAPHIDFDSYLKERGQGDLQSLNVATPKFFTGLDKMVQDTPVGEFKSYMRWHAISSTAWALSSDFQDENFKFSQVLSGVKEKSDRWKKVVSATDNAMGDALGKKFVETNFSPESKAKVKDMLTNIRAALKDDLTTLPWMTPETRKQATTKLDAITEKVGYPDKWQDYSNLKVERGPFVNNVLSANAWGIKQGLDKIGKKADPTEWGMTPPTVNAYYNPLANEIVFPAGILQAPFFDPKADDAVNYGAIGVVIGHEITHGFDDTGAQFDAVGNLRDWWTAEDKKRFTERSEGIIAQANDYKVQGDVHLNGPLVVGESMADLGGVELAFQALQKSRAGKVNEMIDGFNPEQRFFLGFAQVWAGSTRPESELMQISTDPHPVAAFRINGTLSNVPEFAQAFGAHAGDPMVRPDDLRTILWETPQQAATLHKG